MAKAGNHGEIANAMDYSAHERTYSGFLKLTKWTIAGCVSLLIAMAAGFFAGFGLFGGILVFAILSLASYFVI